MTPSRFSFKRRRRQENEKGEEENLDRQQKRRKKKLKLKTLMWLTKKNGETQKPDKNQQQTLRRAFSVPCVHEKTPYITELFAHPSKSVERLRFPAVTVVNNNDAIYMDTYGPPTKDDLNNSVEQDKKNEEEKKERNTKESSQKSVEIFKEDSDVVIAPAFIGNSKDLTDHQTKKIDIEEESSFSEETLPNKRRRKSLDKLKSFGFISAVIIGLLLITILVLLADKITVLLSCPRLQQTSNTSSTTLPNVNAEQDLFSNP
ncbi:uncharacterized protein LOC143465355 isoform X2 [Clavelina lepadiformis]|uniref:uncharacterized protein LOC143465355 isoform X2 n=1 Tax=Clavelina lepadiformis TaxID=159417 RepID=UPI0040419FB8